MSKRLEIDEVWNEDRLQSFVNNYVRELNTGDKDGALQSLSNIIHICEVMDLSIRKPEPKLFSKEWF
jgi:hypothetical protein